MIVLFCQSKTNDCFTFLLTTEGRSSSKNVKFCFPYCLFNKLKYNVSIPAPKEIICSLVSFAKYYKTYSMQQSFQ
jgi:hypothetical protein